MSPSFYLQYALHGVCEWGAAFAIAFWISQAWSQEPAPILVQWIRGSQRQWLMVAFGIAPFLLSLLLQPLFIKLYANGAAAGTRIPIFYFLSLVYGTLVGLASSCCAAPATAQQEFRPGPPVIVSAVLISCSFLLNTLLGFQYVAHMFGGIVLALVILFVARSMIVGVPPPAPAAEPAVPSVQRALWPALVIGFMPAALILTAIAVGSSMNLSNESSKALLVVCSVVSVVCCFTASILLFKRHTGGAIAGGVLLMLLNAFIAFFFGCCAALTGASFR